MFSDLPKQDVGDVVMQRLVVGISGPFSGPRAAYGELLQTAYRAWSSRDTVEAVFFDDESNPLTALIVADKFVQMRANVVVGHFNSECARAASVVYSAAQIPLLLPASTLPSLTDNPFVYRLCASDLKQIDAIAQRLHRQTLGPCWIWSDGSEYANRLKELLHQTLSGVREFDLAEVTVAERATIVCFGAYHNVANAISAVQRVRPKAFFICCDDCAIDAFAQTVAPSECILVAAPVPSFNDCIRAALRLVTEFLASASTDFSNWLENHALFNQREMRSARFSVGPPTLAPVSVERFGV